MFTEGEWMVGYDNHGNGGFNEWYVIENGMSIIAKVLPLGGRLDDEDTANANLIAAAPLLYEALKGMLDYAGYSRVDIPMSSQHQRNRVTAANKALVKAEAKSK